MLNFVSSKPRRTLEIGCASIRIRSRLTIIRDKRTAVRASSTVS